MHAEDVRARIPASRLQARPATNATALRFQHTLKDSYEYIEVEKHVNDKGHGVGLIRLNRPKALNALNAELLSALDGHLSKLKDDPEIGCIVLTGSEKAFAAGADIKEMAENSYIDMLMRDHFGVLKSLNECRIPIIAAVSGYALGGGCEVAMMCDMIVCSESAKVGMNVLERSIR